jgi:hypothetical protein
LISTCSNGEIFLTLIKAKLGNHEKTFSRTIKTTSSVKNSDFDQSDAGIIFMAFLENIFYLEKL